MSEIRSFVIWPRTIMHIYMISPTTQLSKAFGGSLLVASLAASHTNLDTEKTPQLAQLIFCLITN